jgi:hypothetical protein
VRKIILSYDLSLYNQMLQERYFLIAALDLGKVAFYVVVLACITWKRID